MQVAVKSFNALLYAAISLIMVMGFFLKLGRDPWMGSLPRLITSGHAATVAPLTSSLSLTTDNPASTDAVAVPAAEPVSYVTPRGHQLSEQDRLFLEQAGEAGLQVDKVSRGVLPALVYPEVREYAYKILGDQHSANSELQSLANSRGVTIPEPSKVAIRQWVRSEESIDQHYIALVLEQNQAVATLFEEALHSDDFEIARFAQQSLPGIRNHLQAARELAKSIGAEEAPAMRTALSVRGKASGAPASVAQAQN